MFFLPEKRAGFILWQLRVCFLACNFDKKIFFISWSRNDQDFYSIFSRRI